MNRSTAAKANRRSQLDLKLLEAAKLPVSQTRHLGKWRTRAALHVLIRRRVGHPADFLLWICGCAARGTRARANSNHCTYLSLGPVNTGLRE